MATKTLKNDQHGKVKVRIIEFELEGSDISLQESLKSISAALSRQAAPAVSRSTRYEQISKQTDGQDAVHELDENESTLHVDTGDDAPAVTPKRPRKPTKVITPTVLRDVRFDDVSPTFAEFSTGKDPKGDRQRYLVVAFWLKTYKQIDEININHIYTAFKIVSWPIPASVVQPMRELAASRDGRFSKGQERGSYAINHLGENAVNKLAAQ